MTATFTTPRCMMCDKSDEVEVDPDALRAWREGALIQEAFPDMTPEDREHLKTGTHPACWDSMFADEEE